MPRLTPSTKCTVHVHAVLVAPYQPTHQRETWCQHATGQGWMSVSLRRWIVAFPGVYHVCVCLVQHASSSRWVGAGKAGGTCADVMNKLTSSLSELIQLKKIEIHVYSNLRRLLDTYALFSLALVDACTGEGCPTCHYKH